MERVSYIYTYILFYIIFSDGTHFIFFLDAGAYPSPLLYNKFPKSVCTSINNVACHGIPDCRELQDGDIVNVDVTVRHSLVLCLDIQSILLPTRTNHYSL